MANKLKNLPIENKHLENFQEFLPRWDEMCKKTFEILKSYGLIEVSTAYEHALANKADYKVISLDFSDFTDGSDAKLTTVRRRSKNSAYSAPVNKIKNKLGGLRVQVYDRIFDKFYYFVIPRFAYENRNSIEIPFDKSGNPYRQTNNWWQFEVESLDALATTPIQNDKNTYLETKLAAGTSTFNSHYEYI